MKLKDELVLKTFEQFAVNQNSKENVFLKTLGFLGAVIFGFAYSYREFLKGDALAWEGFAYISTASIILLGGGAWLIVAIAYSFRRDQYVISRIKANQQLIGKSGLYPKEYNPVSIYFLKSGWRWFPPNARSLLNQFEEPIARDHVKFVLLRWMPDMFIIYYCLFPVFILFMLFVFVQATVSDEQINYSFIHTIVFTFDIGLFLASLYLPVKYSRKLFRRLMIWHGIAKSPMRHNLGEDRWKEVERLLELPQRPVLLDEDGEGYLAT
jgi:hypothetical protein